MIVARPPSFDGIPDPLGDDGIEAPRLPALAARLGVTALDRVQTERRRHAALVLSLGWLISHLVVFGVRHDWMHLPSSYLASHLLAPLLLALLSLWVATRSGRWGLGTNPRRVALLAVAGPLSFGIVSVVMPAPNGLGYDAHPWLGALICSDLMLVWMSAPLFAAAFALRASFASGAVWRSALIGSSVGLGSGVAINLHCSNGHPFHLVLGHGVPIVAGSLFAAFVVTRWLRT
jgi:hypothetical protein